MSSSHLSCRYLELLEKQTNSVDELVASSATYRPSFDAAYEKIYKSDEIRNNYSKFNDESHPDNVKSEESLEYFWNLFDGSILYPIMQNVKVEAITTFEAEYQHLSLQKRKAINEVNSESGKKQCKDYAFKDEDIENQKLSLDGNDEFLNADLFLHDTDDNVSARL